MAKKKKGKKKEKKASRAPEIQRMTEEDFAPIREEFVVRWSQLMVGWGFPKALGTVHATLLAHGANLSMAEVRVATGLSQGTAHTMLKRLVTMQLAKVDQDEESRKVNYEVERDAWQVALAVMKVRRERELEPLLAMGGLLEQLPHTEGLLDQGKATGDSPEMLGATLRPVLRWAEQVDELFQGLEAEDERWWMRLAKRWKTRT
jgi:DNA-binding transcriptional regulator GbsR (MarR family)